jgi:hypothetical protein
LRFLPDIDLDESGLTTCCDDFCNDGLSLALATTTDDDFGTYLPKASALALPIPLVAPVMRTTLFSKVFMRMLMGFSLWCQHCFV